MQLKKKDFEEEMEEIQKIFLIELYLAHCFFFLFYQNYLRHFTEDIIILSVQIM